MDVNQINCVHLQRHHCTTSYCTYHKYIQPEFEMKCWPNKFNHVLIQNIVTTPARACCDVPAATQYTLWYCSGSWVNKTVNCTFLFKSKLIFTFLFFFSLQIKVTVKQALPGRHPLPEHLHYNIVPIILTRRYLSRLSVFVVVFLTSCHS